MMPEMQSAPKYWTSKLKLLLKHQSLDHQVATTGPLNLLILNCLH